MASPQRIPIADLFRNPEKVGFCISQDGLKLGYLAPFNGRLNVHVMDIATGFVRRLTDQGTRNIAGLTWASSTQILYIRDVGGDENWQLFIASVDGDHTECLTPFAGVQSRVVDLLPEIEDEILISMNQRDASCFDVYRCNIRTAKLTLVAQNPGNVTSWTTDHEGRIRIATASDGVNHAILYRENDQDEFQQIISTDFRQSVVPLSFTFDNKQLVMGSNIGRNTQAIVLFDPTRKEFGQVLFENAEYDMQDIIVSEKRKCIVGALYWGARRETMLCDAEYQALIDDIQAKIPNQKIRLTDCSKDERRHIVESGDARNAASYYLYDCDTKELQHIADARPWLRSEDLCAVEPVVYRSRDGLTIHGYLTLPKDFNGKQAPVVMYPHGGPWARDFWQFDPNVQFFASRGYAVMQMNFRGSTGYGRAFWEASFKQWGRTMQNDISDAVAWLCEQGIADPKRIAIVGGSYGGYAVLSGLAFTPDLYCCGVDIVGVSNLFTFRKTVPEYWKPMNDMMDEMIGNPITEADLLRQVSPFFHAHNIRVPLLVFQGAKDPRVNIAESDQVVDALRKNGVDAEYVVKAEEGHGFVNEENRLEMMEIMEKFLAKHLG